LKKKKTTLPAEVYVFAPKFNLTRPLQGFLLQVHTKKCKKLVNL